MAQPGRPGVSGGQASSVHWHPDAPIAVQILAVHPRPPVGSREVCSQPSGSFPSAAICSTEVPLSVGSHTAAGQRTGTDPVDGCRWYAVQRRNADRQGKPAISAAVRSERLTAHLRRCLRSVSLLGLAWGSASGIPVAHGPADIPLGVTAPIRRHSRRCRVPPPSVLGR